MRRSQYYWQYPSVSDETAEQLNQLQLAGLNYSPAFLRLCLQRGLNTPQAIQQATNQEPQLYHDPFLLYDMDRAVERLHQAIERGEHILIYGDYDADGITSTLILVECLESLGANYSYYLPNRLIDGYGPNLNRYKQKIEEDGVQLILTCDNGVAGFEAIDYAMQQNVDVIVSDHHELPPTLPDAYAIVHPKHPKGDYPFKELCGAGVALKLAHALTGELPAEALELAAIGTIADLVSLTDENRTLVLSGLGMMKETVRLGLEMLLTQEKVNLQEINTETIGFIVGPRLNAIGRLGDPTPALELLRAEDEDEALALLQIINEQNKERQSIVTTITQQVIQRIEAKGAIPDIIIEADADWPAGVLGIVASRLVEQYHRPALIFQYLTEKEQFRGSGRSIAGINLFRWLSEQSEYIAQFGGHDQAAGLTIDAQQWELFNQSMADSAIDFREILAQKPELCIDVCIQPEECTVEFIQECAQLGPFGMDNPKPMIAFDPVQLKQKRLIGSDQQHVKFVVADIDSDKSVEGIGFNKAALFETINLQQECAIAGELSLNQWNGQITPQVQLKDLAVFGMQWRDFRASKINPAILSAQKALFMYQQSALGEWLKQHINTSSVIASYDEIETFDLSEFEHLVLFQPPANLKSFDNLMQHSWALVDLGVYLEESKWLAGLPTRADFAMIYRWIQQQKEPINVRNTLPQLSKQFNLPIVKLKGIFHVFFEANFVTINNGFAVAQVIDSNTKHDLFKTSAYQQYEKAYQAEALLNYQTIDQIKLYIDELRN
ncbi:MULTISPECIES: single-stranded-DNA-specific exonuclease RecJ [unclassified Facklamia]|uniref:single-stranded-DNA-specific exonuclease RecJ n=1 Tax=Aerococcaceae TaxID=186827 RepID=UPI0013B67532|nr:MULTISPECIES: single-stranded-DNA-specific exonuclease RecJ [unclassified Facklamia]NEW64795.1 single-stranded-DNA-specific exonuclease RecJ [Facklamia sp. 252]NEW68117.1 single-stranded-DNA-specific exonuclease RecJ [Facklamia sp. 253]QQD64950.1 single-stranded-DNA-specific exonuclease RecJ [Aerococcaceae bacterium zg-252]